ncbi:MAG: DNA cytosine methyltransferase [Thermodesulfobacteriota bacterium]|nr:DNA cytosine methyltransferase [Thermodesulfobacteriota bacterium]
MPKLNVISLFTGAGGLDYGFEAAGFTTRVAIEMDSDCCETIKKNRDWPVICQDINDVSSEQILKTAGIKKGKVDVLIGGPPCQPFSKSGYWVNGDTLRLNDKRANTLYAYMRCVSDLLPKVFFLENVHGINFSGKEEGFLLLERLTKEINRQTGMRYKLSWRVLDSSDYGVPQARTRFFLIGHREGERFQFPEPTHGDLIERNTMQLSLLGHEILPKITAWDAIGDIKPTEAESLKVRGRWATLLPSIPEGENYLWHTNRKGGLPLFGWRAKYWSFLLKLAKNKPSWTIQAQPGPAIGPFHWKNRLLSVREMARIQTFPDNINFVGIRLSIQRQIGNAVPSLIAEILAREIGEQFFGMSKSESPTLKITYKRPIPPPEPVELVPEEYHYLQGDHPDHPGEGNGNRVKKAKREDEKNLVREPELSYA